MQQINSAYWKRARQVLAAERTSQGASRQPWSALRRVSGELLNHLDPFHARALLELGLGLARPHVPSLDGALLNDDGTIGGLASIDEHAEEAVLACVLGLVAATDGAERLQERLASLWPGDPDPDTS